MDNQSNRKNVEIFRGPPRSNLMTKISIKTRPVQNDKSESVRENASPVFLNRHARPHQSEPVREPASPVVEQKPAEKARLTESVRMFGENNEISDNIMEVFSTCPNFNVISAIGPQGSGKSTILSMLSGNNSKNLYREYYFRPVSREANELSRHQTMKFDVFISNHHIFIDCQPTHSFSILEALTRSNKLDDVTAHTDTLKHLAFLLNVSHTVLVCAESYIDLNLIKTIRAAELIRPQLKKYEPRLSMDRKANLIFLHTKACPIDFTYSVLSERRDLLKDMFRDSRWLRLSENPEMVLVPLPEISLRREQIQENIDTDHPSNAVEVMTEFDEIISQLREELFKNRVSFTENSGDLDEIKWAELCQETMNDSTFQHLLAEFRTCKRGPSYSKNYEK